MFEFFKREGSETVWASKKRYALVIGDHSLESQRTVDFLRKTGYRVLGLSNAMITSLREPYLISQYRLMPFKGDLFSLVVATHLVSWHIYQGKATIINNVMLASELSRVVETGGFFLARMFDLQGFHAHLLAAGFIEKEFTFGPMSVYEKKRSSAKELIRSWQTALAERMPKKQKEAV